MVLGVPADEKQRQEQRLQSHHAGFERPQATMLPVQGLAKGLPLLPLLCSVLTPSPAWGSQNSHLTCSATRKS